MRVLKILQMILMQEIFQSVQGRAQIFTGGGGGTSI